MPWIVLEKINMELPIKITEQEETIQWYIQDDKWHGAYMFLDDQNERWNVNELLNQT